MSAVAVAAAGCAAVLALDTLGSLAARRFDFRYQWLAPLSLALYAATGYLTAQAGGHFLAGAAAGAAAGAVDATFGWRISNALGLGDDRITERMEPAIATTVTLLAAVAGAVAGLFA